MWTDTTRAHHARAGLALPSDLTDAEWAVLEPFFLPPFVGRPRKWPLRRIVEAILYLLRGGLPWRCCRPASRRSRRCGAGSTCGATMACGPRSTTTS